MCHWRHVWGLIHTCFLWSLLALCLVLLAHLQQAASAADGIHVADGPAAPAAAAGVTDVAAAAAK